MCQEERKGTECGSEGRGGVEAMRQRAEGAVCLDLMLGVAVPEPMLKMLANSASRNVVLSPAQRY